MNHSQSELEIITGPYNDKADVSAPHKVTSRPHSSASTMPIAGSIPFPWEIHPTMPPPPHIYESWCPQWRKGTLFYPPSLQVARRTPSDFVLAVLAEEEQSKSYLTCMKLQQEALENAFNKTRHLLIDRMEIFFQEQLPCSSGSYGEVWHCSLLSKGYERMQQVALKRIRLRPEDSPSKRRLLRHLLREVVPWHELDHPNITPFIGYTFSDFAAELVSEWEPMGSLRENMPQSPANGFRIAYQVASGLAYLHSRTPRIIHGDIKPENVLLGADGVARLVDFGLSIILDDALNLGLRSSDGCRNTPLYADPSLFDDKPRNIFTDIWALGWVTYEVVTSRLPYDHVTSWNAKLFAIVRYDVPKPSTHNVEYAEVIWPVLEASWSKDNTNRWSAKRIASHLHSAVAVSSI